MSSHDESPSDSDTTDGACDGAASPDDPLVTPLGGNAGVHIQQEDDDDGDEALAVDFGGFVVSLGTSCMVNLGKHPNPDTGQPNKDLAAAGQTIDILKMLQRKTRGNLDDDERQLLASLLRDLQRAYDDASGH